MNKKAFIIILSALILLTLNFSVAQDLDNVTVSSEVNSVSDVGEVYGISDDFDSSSLKSTNSLIKSHIDVVSNTTFDAVGDSFIIKLLDENNNSISKAKVTFKIGGTTYSANTNANGIASFQLKLKDGAYKVTTSFAGNSKYDSCSKVTNIVMNNTRIVSSGLSNSEIQNIIDNAKANNVILFEGTSYDDINFVINKRLTLLSKSNTVLTSSSSSPIIQINGKGSSSTTIEGFDIRGNGNGIVIRNSDYVTIANNDIKVQNNAIVATNVNYANITKNNIVGNGKNAIVIASANNSYISNNKITKNGENGIVLANTNKMYIYSNTISNNANNGIYTTDKVNGVTYDELPQNLHITQNTIDKNGVNGIAISKAGNNINIKGNTITYNSQNGIFITDIGDNSIQSNEIAYSVVGIKFADEYLKPKNQEISYNAIYHTSHVAVEARDSYYYDFGEPLKIGENWFTDNKLICPKVQSNNLKFVVSQVGENKFQAAFYDSKGNVASLLPDRTLDYTINGQTYSIQLTGGMAVFTADANDGDILKAEVDESQRKTSYSSDIQSDSNPTNGVSPSYDYPSIAYDELYDDIGEGTGDGEGNGNGHGSGINNGGSSTRPSSDNVGNTTSSQNMNPGQSSNTPASEVSQSSQPATAPTQAGASQTGGASSNSNSVVKQILLDEDDFFRVTGIFFIMLLIILTIGFYYRDDIKEMKSKM